MQLFHFSFLRYGDLQGLPYNCIGTPALCDTLLSVERVPVGL